MNTVTAKRKDPPYLRQLSIGSRYLGWLAWEEAKAQYG